MSNDIDPPRPSAEEPKAPEAPETDEPGERRRKRAERKDRLIQTRVPEGLESALKEEAHRRRLTVSHLIRNMLEDTFHLVDGVVEEVDNLVGDSMNLAFTVGEDAQKIAQAAKRGADRFRQRKEQATEAAAPGPEEKPAASEETTATSAEASATAEVEPAVPRRSLDHVLAWNRVLLNQPASCAHCDVPLAKGATGYLGLSQDPTQAPAWLCEACARALLGQ